jgi:hypothetical protein
VRDGGEIINLGFPGRGEALPTFNPLDPRYVYFKAITIKPLKFISEQDVLPKEFRFNLYRNLQQILHHMGSGVIPADYIISETIPYKDLALQYQKYLSRNASLFTSILTWQ